MFDISYLLIMLLIGVSISLLLKNHKGKHNKLHLLALILIVISFILIVVLK